MNSNEINQTAFFVLAVISSKTNRDKTNEELVDIVSSILYPFARDQREIGRNQILNHFKMEIENLQK